MPTRPSLRFLVVLALALLPAPLRAQTGFGSDNSPPTVSLSPASGSTFTSPQVSVTITWHDATALDPTTLSITLNGQSVAGQFTYSGNNTSATSVGTITLAAGANTLAASMCDQQPNCPSSPTTATYTYNAPPPPPPSTYAVSVTPDAGTASAAAGATGLSQAFTLTNQGNTSATYGFAVSCSGNVSCASAPAAVTVAAGASASVNVGYAALGPGLAHVRLVATRSGYTLPSDSGSVDVVVNPAATYSVEALPDGGTATLGTGGTGVSYFTIRNTGNQPTASPMYSLSVTCTGAVVSCTPASAAADLPGGQWTRLGVTYTAASTPGTGRIRVVASHPTLPYQDTAWIDVTVDPSAVVHPMVSVADVNPSASLERGDCMRVSVGVGESECGDLVYGHALPSVRALNKVRAPMLVYNSQTGHPRPVVMANVTIPSGASVPTSVSAVLTVDGGQVATQTWTGSAFTPGTAKRISMGFDGASYATGLHPYTLQVTATYPGGSALAGVEDTLAIVNRGASPFGAGWWLNGLEQVMPVPQGMLWIGGDGSTRLYRPSGILGLWLAEETNETDTLVMVDAPNYVRRLRGGGEVRFSGATGMQTSVVNRLGMTTDFTWDSRGALVSISLPHGNGFTAPAGVSGWTFSYSAGTAAYLDSVSVAGPTPGSVRSVRIGRSGADVVQITDPDRLGVGFTYGSGVPHVWSDHLLLDTVGVAYAQTHLTWHASGKLAAVRHYAGGTTSTAADPVTTLTVPETWGWMGATPPNASDAYGKIDGPRASPVNDWTYYWVDRYGQPTQMQDALGNLTLVYRRDWRFPSLVTGVDRPGGGATPGQYGTRLITIAFYDELGRAVLTGVHDPVGTGQYALTTYAFTDPRFPYHATRVTSPTGLVSSTGYDSVGNRLWQQAGPGAARRVAFGYDAVGRVTSVRSQRAASAGEAAETMEYTSALGNLTAVVSPLGVRTTYQQDAVGRDTLTLSPIDTLVDDVTGARTVTFQQQVTRYDAGDRVVQTVSSAPGIKFPSYIAPNATAWDSVAAESITVTNTYQLGRLMQVSRVASPDTAHVGTVTTAYRYDALGRKTVEIAPDGQPDTTWYDPAGNVIATKSRRGMVDSLYYDALNRLVRRHVPSYTEPLQQVIAGADTWFFPLYRDDGSGGLDNRTSLAGLAVPGEEATFAYDGAGNMVRADNGDAQVRRTYYLGGALKTDTLHIRTYRGADFGRHVYALSYTYDLEGRRVGVQIPDSVAPQAGAVTQSYAYDPATGALSSITDPLANVYRFGYDDDQRLTTFSRNGFTETSEYDADGRRTRRSETQPGSGSLLHDDRYTYDVRGKQRYVRTLADSTYMGYSGLGTLARGFTGSRSSQGTSSNERYVQDPLGNMVTDQSTAQGANKFQYDGQPPANERHFQPGTGRLLWGDQGVIQSFALVKSGWDSTTYDPAGNRWLYRQSHPQSTPYSVSDCWRIWGCATTQGSTMTLKEAARQYYGADERLRVVDRRTCYLNNSAHCDTVKQPLPSQRGAFEEYRYDALGRRVLVRSRQSWICQSRCQSVTRRVIWDGDQLLAEIQAPGQDSSLAAMEQDRGFQQHAASAVTPPDTSLDGSVTSPTTAYPGFYYGRVVYIHGGGIDHPLAIERMEYSDSLPGAYTIYPHENWKGAFDLGSYDGGTLNPPCKVLSDAGFVTPFQVFVSGDASGMKTAPTDTTSHCLSVSWPAPHLWLTNRSRDKNLVGQDAWNGSLVEGMRDATGQMYMRNRYYDPQSARFTQEDPIGIAGGLNVYGFAGGDPVSYSDPYGLTCPDPKNPTCVALGYEIFRAFGVSQSVSETVWTAAAHGARFIGPGTGMMVSAFGEGLAAQWGVSGPPMIDPAEVRYSQESAGGTFKDTGKPITDLAEGLKSGQIDPANVEPIRLVERDGKLYSLDNRRLWAFKEAGKRVPYRMATEAEVQAEGWKFTTKNDGTSIRIRGGT